ncbi:MAG TPA: phosphoribosyltransferase family protein [Kofleriaceae bacterium]|nr:phosphoribosyltransferase family protein [Kofleriaceae bacterium]
MTFSNRHDAGRQLGEALASLAPNDPVVLGLWRGGVPIAAEVARALQAPLDICIVRKLSARGDIAIGAVAEGGAVYLDEREVDALGLSPTDIDFLVARELVEIGRDAELLRDHPPVALRGRDAVLVDDGVVTANTMRAAIRALTSRGVRSITVAVPVGALESVLALRREVDRVVCLVSEPMLTSVGSRYRDFSSVSQAEVVALLEGSRRDRTSLGWSSSATTLSW